MKIGIFFFSNISIVLLISQFYFLVFENFCSILTLFVCPLGLSYSFSKGVIRPIYCKTIALKFFSPICLILTVNHLLFKLHTVLFVRWGS